MRDRAVVANRGPEAAQEMQDAGAHQHAPARQRRQHQARDRADVNQNDPREEQLVALRRAPPRLLPRLILRQLDGVHRREAFAACIDLVDEVKRQLPVWKRQVFDDGTDEWVGMA